MHRIYRATLIAVSLMVALVIGAPSNRVNAAGVGTRTYNSPRPPMRLLAKQFNGNADVFPTADPSPAGTPLTLTSATGISGANGQVTVALHAGFTAPLVLTVYQWQQDDVTTANRGWIRIAPAATGSDVYSKSIDTNYAIVNFAIAENTPFLIRADQSVTGNVYVDAKAHSSNANSATGYTGEGE